VLLEEGGVRSRYPEQSHRPLIPAIVSHVSDDTLHDDSDDALRRANAALRARQESPRDARSAAVEVLATPDISDEARRVGLWALGLAERELNELDAAERHLRDGLDLAVAQGADRDAARITSALVAVVAARGRPDEALGLAASVGERLPPDERADLEMKRALVLEQLGRLGEAIVAYDAALDDIVLGDDRVLEARVRANRSIVLALRGRTSEALHDAELAEQLAVAERQWFLAGGAAHNHGYFAGLCGDVVTALESFARADEFYGRVGHPGRSAGVLASDRCEVMLAAGLWAEARQHAAHAVAALEAVGDISDLAEARLLFAKACLAAGDAPVARREAAIAHGAFVAAGREGWSIAAEFVGFRAATAVPDADETVVVARAATMADELARLGWLSEATIVRVTAADIAISLGHVEVGRALLQTASAARRQGRAGLRAEAWLATARLRLVDQDHDGARRAVLAGLRVLDQHRMTVGATDLRVGAAVHARGLADLGLGMALERGRPADVLRWAERVRAHAVEIPAVRPPDDAGLAAALTELRRDRIALEEARRAGDGDPALAVTVRRHEERVRDLARVASGASARTGPMSVVALRRALGAHRRLVEFVDVHGQLSAVVIGGRRHVLHHLGAVEPVAELIDAASFCLDRLARDSVSQASAEASAASLRDVGHRLSQLLVEPLGLDDCEVVIVPTGVLHGVPWGVLEILSERPVTIAASARRWLSRTTDHRLDPTLAVITGPGLEHARREAAAVRGVRPEAEVLIDASVEAALKALDRVATAHISCHGQFRSDSPMFSSLRLADGPLTVYDIEALGSPPALVVLPACNAGAAAVSVGNEVVGTAAALLGAGVGAVIAPLTNVNDAATVQVMELLHRELAAGRTPPAALARTRAGLGRAEPTVRASAASFVCLA
jgi:hypothetical protein